MNNVSGENLHPDSARCTVYVDRLGNIALGTLLSHLIYLHFIVFEVFYSSRDCLARSESSAENTVDRCAATNALFQYAFPLFREYYLFMVIYLA